MQRHSSPFWLTSSAPSCSMLAMEPLSCGTAKPRNGRSRLGLSTVNMHRQRASSLDDPRAQIEIIQIDSSIDRFAVFSDGIENLVLDHRTRSAPAQLFERLLEPVATWEGTGRSRKLSKHLRDYLGSEKVCAATDDDKSLILGARS